MTFARKIIATAAVALGMSGAASASTITVSYQGSGPFGSPNLSQTVNIQSPTPGYSGWAGAGMMRLAGSGVGNFLAFCVDLGKTMASGQSYTTASASGYGAAVDANISKLFNSFYATVDTAVEAAGFQLALWEIITDTGSGPLDVYAGGFSTGNSAAGDQAQTYLGGLMNMKQLAGTVGGGYTVTYLNSANSQNLVTVSPVPVPASLGMLGLGIAGMIGLKRRRKAA